MRRMVNAVEVMVDRAGKDDAERQRNRSRLYQPPAAERRRNKLADAARRPTGMGRAAAEALMADLAEEDATHQRGRQ